MTSRPAGLKRPWLALVFAGLLISLILACWHDYMPAANGQLQQLTLAEITHPKQNQHEPDVALPHHWSRHSADSNGVVAYRLSWTQNHKVAVAILIPGTNMAATLRVNGHVLHQDSSFTEPLSRSWNTPRHFILPEAIVKTGLNVIDLKVKGFAIGKKNNAMAWHSGGITPVWVGTPNAIERQYQYEYFFRHDLALFNLVTNIMLGLIFAALALLHRQDSVYGWFALACLAWAPMVSNHLMTTPWPFPDTHSWQTTLLMLSTLYVLAYTLFLIKMVGFKLPLRDRHLFLLCLLISGLITYFPDAKWLSALLLLFSFAMQTLFLYQAQKHKSFEFYVMISIVSLVLLTLTLDLLIAFHLLPYHPSLVSLTGIVFGLGMAMILAWRYVHNHEKIERFQAHILQEVQYAEHKLSQNLISQHQLDLKHARIGERLNLIRDLHSGFGSTLAGHISHLTRPNSQLSHLDWTITLKTLRDDLRLIIETSSANQHRLAEQLPSLRRRLTEEMERADIEGSWHFDALDRVNLPLFIQLNCLRFLQEAVNYLIEHAQARHLNIRVEVVNTCLWFKLNHDGITDFAHPQTLKWQNLLLRTQNIQGQLLMNHAAGQPGLSLCLTMVDTALKPSSGAQPHA